MICPQCGTNVPDAARFCPKCGNSFVAATPGAPPPDQQPTVPSAPVSPPQPPYAAPQPPYEPQPPAAAGAYTLFASYPAAGLGGRIGAYLLDGIVASLLILPAFAMMIVGLLRGGAEMSPVTAVAAPVLYGLGGLWAVVYYVIKDGLKGASFGRRIVGETVVSLKTGAPAQ